MSFRLTLLPLLPLLITTAATAAQSPDPSDTGLPEQSREALRQLVDENAAPRPLDRRPGILGPATSFPTGENAAYYMDEVRLQPGEPDGRANADATPVVNGDGAGDNQK